MRILVLALAAALLLSGCLQQAEGSPQPPSQNSAPPSAAPGPENATPPAQNLSSGNISQAPPPTQAYNQSMNLTNQSMNQSQGSQSGNATNSTAPANETTKPAGLPFPGSNYSLFLDDVSLVPTSSEPCGIFSIRDASSSILDKLLICPPESQDWTSPEGHLYRIRVDEVAAGYTMQTNWAKVEIFG